MSQAVPPAWRDVGKANSDLLNRDYPLAGTALEIKTKTASGVTFKVAGVKTGENVITADLEGKFSDAKKGLTLTQVWTTANVLRTQVELENHLAKGLKLDLATTLNPEKNAKGAVVSALFKAPGVNAKATVDLFKGPTFTADAVASRDGFLVGGEASYDQLTGAITRYSAAVGYTAPEYAATIHALGNLSLFSASYYHRVNPETEAGAKAVYNTKASGVNLEVGVKTYLDPSSFVKAKINNFGLLALGYTQALRPGVKASFGVALDTQRLSAPLAGSPGHKVGASFTFES
jgi:voltage-dependent anion channel protein 2